MVTYTDIKNNFESSNSATFGLKGVGEIFSHFFPPCLVKTGLGFFFT